MQSKADLLQVLKQAPNPEHKLLKSNLVTVLQLFQAANQHLLVIRQLVPKRKREDQQLQELRMSLRARLRLWL